MALNTLKCNHLTPLGLKVLCSAFGQRCRKLKLPSTKLNSFVMMMTDDNDDYNSLIFVGETKVTTQN